MRKTTMLGATLTLIAGTAFASGHSASSPSESFHDGNEAIYSALAVNEESVPGIRPPAVKHVKSVGGLNCIKTELRGDVSFNCYPTQSTGDNAKAIYNALAVNEKPVPGIRPPAVKHVKSVGELNCIKTELRGDVSFSCQLN